jgi:hypothetical protein
MDARHHRALDVNKPNSDEEIEYRRNMLRCMSLLLADIVEKVFFG